VVTSQIPEEDGGGGWLSLSSTAQAARALMQRDQKNMMLGRRDPCNEDDDSSNTGGRDLAEDHDTELNGSRSFRSLNSSERIKKFSTLQNLLDAAVGSSSELENVNFRYLHEVISEIIRYLGQSRGITKKLQSQLPKRNTSDTNLPLVRRLEATESFIQELASTVKRINSDIARGGGEPHAASEATLVAHTKDVNNAISRLSTKLQNIDKKFNDYATKESLSEQSITPEYVKSVINESIQTCKCDIDASLRERNDKINTLHDLVRNDVHFFEERIKKIAQKNQDMEERLKKKADAAALDWKCDRKEFESLSEEARSFKSSLHSEINQVKESVRLTSDSLTGIKQKSDEFSMHQKKFGGIIRRFETEVEDARNSIHYLKTSTTAQQEAKNNTEEAIAKIRNIQSGIDEKQRVFQSALEDLSNEFKRTDLRFASLADDIKTLREQKADEVVVHNALATKAEKKHSINEMKLNEFELDIDQRLKSMAQKIAGNESNTQRWMGQIMDQLDKSLNIKKNELKDIRTYIDQRLLDIGKSSQSSQNDHNSGNSSNNRTSATKLPRKRSSSKSSLPATSRTSSYSATTATNCIVCDAETKKADTPWAAGGGWVKILIYLIFSHIISMFLVSKLGASD